MGELIVHPASEGLLTPRWTKLRFVKEQDGLIKSTARFRMAVAGRRAGKTEILKRFTAICAMEGTEFDDPRFALCAPTRDQARNIFWKDMKALIPPWMVGNISESHLTIDLINGSLIAVVGMDKPQRIEGAPWDGIGLDEIADVKEGAFAENVLPALMDRRGWCWLTGVPEGRNHYWELYKKALQSIERGEEDWSVHEWSSRAVVDADEIARMESMMDEDSIAQEIDANFLNPRGRVYKSFKNSVHVRRHIHEWNPERPIVFCFDFNVDPGVAVICQEKKLSTGETGTAVIGEVHIEGDSNTEKVCRRLIEDWQGQQGPVYIYGDRTGGSRGSAKLDGSDWDIIKRDLRNRFDIRDKVPEPPNPPPRNRVNAVNSRLMTASGVVSMEVDPSCKFLIRDLEGVIWAPGSAGEISKKDKKLTHLTDALGYYIYDRWPVLRALQREEAELRTG